MSNSLIGIDLGTTFSAIATLDDIGKPQIVPNSDSERITPSAVWFDLTDQQVEVGTAALEELFVTPEQVAVEPKRWMGDDYQFSIGSETYSPTQIAALILRKLARDAESTTGEIKKVVITVPANFSESARAATMEAGKQAGLVVSHIINEPTAAVIYYATEHELSGRVLVYDLGGGTFDVTIADVKGQEVTIVTSQGDRHLGGKDIDRDLLQYCADAYQVERGSALPSDPISTERYLNECEKAKRRFARARVEDVRIPFDVEGELPFQAELTREKFDELLRLYIARTETLIDVALSEAGSDSGDISEVILVGGSTRLSVVTDSLKQKFGKDPLTVGNVDEAVALGAAVYAGMKIDSADLNPVQRAAVGKVKLTDVCNSFFGTEALGKDLITHNSILLEKNTPLPCSKTETYYTVMRNQARVDCTVTQSKFAERDIDLVTVISKSYLDLPANLPEHSPIEVTYSYDENERMHAIFTEPSSGVQREVTLTPKSGENPDDEVAGSVDDFLLD